MKYQVTRRQCQDEINRFNNVCDECGRKLKPQKTVDNLGQPTYWAGCMHCQDGVSGALCKFTHGVDKDTYRLAYRLVRDDSVYLGMKFDGYDFEYQFRAGVAKMCSILLSIEHMKNPKNKPYYTKAELRKRFKMI